MKYDLSYRIIEKMQYENFGSFIRLKRQSLEKSLNNFSFDCDIEPATLSNFERNKSDICFTNFTKIAKGFNLTPAQLLYEFENSAIYIDKSQ